MEKEIWKDIAGYEGLYQISNFGSIISNYDNFGRKNIRKINASLGQNGYLKITLYKNKKSKTLLVHRLMGINFIPNPNNYPVVMHLDNIKTNISLSNLKWGTHKDNNHQIIREGRHNFTNGNHPDLGKTRGNNKGARKINQYTTGGIFIKTFECIKDGAEEVGIKYTGICASCKNGTNAGGYKWSYSI